MRAGNFETMATLMAEIDADEDGAITQGEIDAYRTARVSEADTSGDGALDIDEFDTLFRDFTRTRMVDAFQRLDANGDGVIDEDEIDRRVGGLVERLDRNDDGAISREDRRRG